MAIYRKKLLSRTLGIVLLLAAGSLGCGSGSSSSDNPASTETADMDDQETASNDAMNLSFIGFETNSPSSDSVEIRFMTSRETTCEIIYGEVEDELILSATDPMMDGAFSTTHTVLIESLLQETTYYYKAKATDTEGETFYSELRTFIAPETDDSDDKENVALLSSGTEVIDVSSNFGNGDNGDMWGADAALDGSFATEWASDGDGDEAYLSIDLGQLRTLSGFGIRSRKMVDGTAIIQSVQLLFDDTIPRGPFAMSDPDQFYQFDFEEAITAQTVTLEVLTSSGGNTGLKELQFYRQQ